MHSHTKVLMKLAKTLEQNSFICLNRNDVVTAKLSDHHPLVHNNVLFWNVMMKGDKRTNSMGKFLGYNNGFGLEESEYQYRQRLIKIASVIAEIVYRNPTIDAITLCEGPIKAEHVALFFKTIKGFSWMKSFAKFHKPSVIGARDWGLFMFAHERYTVTSTPCHFIEKSAVFSKLANRFQLWTLTYKEQKKQLALAHFPFEGNEHLTEWAELSINGQLYCELIRKLFTCYAQDSLIICADFNLNPYLIDQWKNRLADQIPANNSRLCLLDEKTQMTTIKTVTVDGILLSKAEKQKAYQMQRVSGLNARLVSEYKLFKTADATLAKRRSFALQTSIIPRQSEAKFLISQNKIF